MSDASAPTRFAPEPDPITQPFWDASAEGRLAIQECGECGEHVFYPRAVCPACGAAELQWVDASGRGTVYSFSVVHKAAHPGMASITPYIVAIVELAEGPRMMSNLVGLEPGFAAVGMEVAVRFEKLPNGLSLPLFEPAQ